MRSTCSLVNARSRRAACSTVSARFQGYKISPLLWVKIIRRRVIRVRLCVEGSVCRDFYVCAKKARAVGRHAHGAAKEGRS